MRAGGEKRGNNRDRKRRRAWLLDTFDVDLGPGVARCHLKIAGDRCHGIVDEFTLSVDRLDTGGSYHRGNIQPACVPCQNRQGALITQARRIDWLRYAEEARARGLEMSAA